MLYSIFGLVYTTAMSNFLRLFSNIVQWIVSEVDSRSIENDHIEHEKVEDPENWNPLVLSSNEIY